MAAIYLLIKKQVRKLSCFLLLGGVCFFASFQLQAAPIQIRFPCAENGCLTTLELLASYSLESLQPHLKPGVRVENGYTVYLISYLSQGQPVLATVAVPYGIVTPAEGWSVVSNLHGTTGLADVCALTGTVSGSGLAGLFGSRGLISIAPDYPGLGTAGVHPYLVSESEGKAALDSLRAVASLALELNIPLSQRFAIVGWSQGGHATLAAASLHSAYAPDLDIRAFAVSGPATVWEELWREAVNFQGWHLGFHAMLFYAWQNYYGVKDPSPWTPTMQAKIDSIMTQSCAFALRPNTPLLQEQMPQTADAIFSPTFIEEYRSGQWKKFSVYRTWFSKNRIGAYKQTAPLMIYQGGKDLITPRLHTDALVQQLKSKGIELTYEVVPEGQHHDVAFGFVSEPQLKTQESIDWIKKRLLTSKPGN